MILQVESGDSRQEVLNCAYKWKVKQKQTNKE